MNVNLTDVLQKMMAVHNVSVEEYTVPFSVENIDKGFRNNFYKEFDWDLLKDNFSGMLKEKVMYILCDLFGVYYITFIPSSSMQSIIVVGPYRLAGAVFDTKQYADNKFSSADISVIKQYVLSIPHIHEDVITQQIVPVFSAATDNDKVDIKYIKENPGKNDAYNQFSFVFAPNNNIFSFDKVENRYKIENDILNAVSQGNLTKVKNIMRSFPIEDIGQRYSSMHLQKNSLIIFNTLLRKAVEKANVHPYYLDEISYRFFQKIELIADRSQSAQLINDMLKSYCDYARRYPVEKYSPVVQKALNYIQLNISNKISLDDIAKDCGVSPSHLAKRFHSETGKSVVDFINNTRMINAANKLKETTLSISEIAADCGISDTNYFSRIFKKYMGCSPSEYRK